MVREIVHLQIGQCGNRCGSRFWENLLYESKFSDIEDNPLNQVYYHETKRGPIPRALLIGWDPEQMDKILTGKDDKTVTYNYLSDTINIDNFSTWPLSYYTHGLNYGEKIFDFVRKEVEKCDSLQGFQIVHSIGGGCGSGLSSFVLNGLRDEYPDRTIATFSVFPSKYVSELTLQPYNFVLSLNHLIEMADEVMCFDNEALYNICSKHAYLKYPSYGDLNYYVSTVMSSFTCPFRFPDQLNSTLNKTVKNLVPYKRLHFNVPSIAPISTRGCTHCHNYIIKELYDILFDYKYLLACCNPNDAKSFGASVYFRGLFHNKHDLYNESVIEKTKKFRNFKISTCDVRCHWIPKFASLVENTTAIKEVFDRLKHQFNSIYILRLYKHFFINDGLESIELDEAYDAMKDLIDEYEIYKSDLEYDESDD